jgi:glycine cleavage system aminomethyltransferase T
VLGESLDVRGFWVAEAVWITHSAGVARAMAQWLVDGRPDIDLHECELYRFEAAQLAPSYIATRGAQNFVEVYDIIHPLEPPAQPRPLRISPFHGRQVDLDAYFLEFAGWERPHWYGVNIGLPHPRLPERDDWAARHWSPIAAGEALATRERVGLFDMTPLKRLSVTGPDSVAFLQRMTTNEVDRPPGTVTYSLILDAGAGIRSDITVARLGEHEFQLGVNGNLDLDWLLRHVTDEERVHVRDITGGTCCLGLWGPLAREVAEPLAATGLDFGYFRAARTYLGDVPVTMLRVSYVGELGWEIYCDADVGLRLWDTLWAAGRPHGLVAVGRSAFNSMRLEKGYRAWGVDMTPEHDPYSAGLGFAVKRDKGEFVGRAALPDEPAGTHRLTCLTVDDGRWVVMGREPVYVDGSAAGYVTSAAYGYTVGASIAYAWLPAAVAEPGTTVHIGYFDRMLAATVATEPLFDPQGKRMRS